VEEQETKDYYPEIEKLAINIYLDKIKKIIQELDDYLVKKNLKYEEINLDYREKIKDQTFENLDT